ncbi:tandem-95 repeat protein, partial [Labilibacter marinus]|uniref:tandem-95 repeat protein n=1 Tax=Labilibacter marinus TaxID=1477105 RepID=UPI000950346C
GVLTINTVPVSGPSNGVLVINTDGTYTYTPNTDFNGEDSFTYEVCDDGTPAACTTAIVTITVNEVNDAPIATDDAASVDQEGVLNGGSLLTNDSDPEGGVLTINTVPVSGPSNGVLVINPDGTYTYTPNTDFNGEDSFTYEVCDDGTPSLCSTATVTITVSSTNTAPIAVDDVAEVNEGEVLNGTSLIANDSDDDGDVLSINTTPISGPSNGVLVINPDGTYTYTPNDDFLGEDSFVYEVCDNGTPQECTSATVTITVVDSDNDDDGIPNDEEGEGDTDGDGIKDKDDTDSDNDGILDEDEGNIDTDDDGTPDYKDSDSDDDGISDDEEGDIDTDDDGTPDYKDEDSDDDGILDEDEGNGDKDDDGTPNYKDLDSDGDTIDDGDEGDVDEDGDGDGNYLDEDSDDDGILDEDEGNVDTDNDGTPDYLDEDSDDDGVLDRDESTGDCDNDGIKDYIDTDKCYTEDDLPLYEGFSPNNDGDNDTYQIPWVTQYTKVSIEIFNRWGNVVYKQDKYENNWNGESNVGFSIGKELPVGTYFYIVHIHDIDKKLNGYIYLNR